MNVEVPHRPEDRPGVASAESDVVILDGPNGVAVAFTFEAAAITAYSLLAAAETARNYKPGA